MGFDDIPEDTQEGHPCAQFDEDSPYSICPGSVKKFGGRWCCDTCDYDYGGDKQPDFTDL